MSLQFDMCKVEMDLELANREWSLESAESDLADQPDNTGLQQAQRAAKANLDMWKDYIELLYPETVKGN